MVPSADATASRSGSLADTRPREQAYLTCAFRAADDGTFEPRRHSLADVGEVLIGRFATRGIERGRIEGSTTSAFTTRLTLRLDDPWLSGKHAVISREGDTFVLRDAGSRNHCFVNGAQVEEVALGDGDVIEVGNHFFVFRQGVLGVSGEPLDADTAALGQVAPLLTLSSPLGRVFSRILAAAASDLTVCLGGETGTGKEVVARTIHESSGRKGAFVAVNCAALAPTLIESELFGYRKGAFSGAAEHRLGLVRSADGGTLFLDEIGDMPLPAQAALLRVLQEREVLPVGSTQTVPVDLRVVVATHKDLEALVAEGLFRADLNARLLGLPAELPALRDRKEDLGLLCRVLLKRYFREGPPSVSLETARKLFAHHWPSNVRELDRRIAGAAALAKQEKLAQLEPEHLLFGDESPKTMRLSGRPSAERADLADLDGATEERPLARLTPEDEERRAWLRALLEEHDWNVSAVSRASGKARSQVQRWMIRFDLRR